MFQNLSREEIAVIVLLLLALIIGEGVLYFRKTHQPRYNFRRITETSEKQDKL